MQKGHDVHDALSYVATVCSFCVSRYDAIIQVFHIPTSGSRRVRRGRRVRGFDFYCLFYSGALSFFD